jgi:hypothetical protein
MKKVYELEQKLRELGSERQKVNHSLKIIYHNSLVI